MEMKSPPPCTSTLTVRRQNPYRKARPTPSVIRLREPLDPPSVIRSFPVDDILSEELPVNSDKFAKANAAISPKTLSENIKVYLRIRPITIQRHSANTKITAETRNLRPKNPKARTNKISQENKDSEPCVQVNEDMHSVTVSTPQAFQETKKIKSEVYEGFSHVFSSNASQDDVYEAMVKPLVEGFLKGKSGMLAALGPSGSGKTHTVFGNEQPGVLQLAFRHIFSESESNKNSTPRAFYLSMFEICSEKGKAEKMTDLLHDGSELCLQQWALKGLREVEVCDAKEAESHVARGRLKRSTASTNTNNQSSRSQCIINIRSASKESCGEVDSKASSTIFTVVDLAGAEREKKTGNQGGRLVESNFINNTSMVFGLCMRALLAHQKNPKKPLQKHYQNSLLTRYLRDYLEGKKRMTLILTVKPGVEDYPDTSFLLRQASPFTNIMFKEEPELNRSKRPNQGCSRAEKFKKVKINGGNGRDIPLNTQEIAGKLVKGERNSRVEDTGDENLVEIQVQSGKDREFQISRHKDGKDREFQILFGLSKALWTVLKQYKKRVEGLEIENHHLRNSLHSKASSIVSSCNMKELEQTEDMKKTYPPGADSSLSFPSCSGVVDNGYNQQVEDILENTNYAHEVKGFKDTGALDTDSRIEDFSVSIDDAQDSNCSEDVGTRDIDSRSEATGGSLLPSSEDQIGSVATDLHTSRGSESSCKDDIFYEMGGEKLNIENKGFEIENRHLRNSLRSKANSIASSCHMKELEQTEDIKTTDPTQIENLLESTIYANEAKGLEDTGTLDIDVRNEDLPVSSDDAQDSNYSEDVGRKDTDSRSESTGQLGASLLPSAEEQIGSVAADSHTSHASGSPCKSDVFAEVKEEKVNIEDKEHFNLPGAALHKEETVLHKSKFTPGLNCNNSQHAEKPKRRLLAASSVLLKDMSMLDANVKDENDARKGARRSKNVPAAAKNITQGSLSLLHLLKTKI